MRITTKPAIAFAAVLAATLSSCSGLNGSTSGPSAEGNGKTQSSAITAVTMGTIKLITGPQNPGSQIGMGLCEPLTGIDEDGKVFMRGAQSVTSDDQLTWTIKVAPGRTFSDGTPITAKTWTDSFNFTAVGANGMAGNYAFIDVAGYPALNPEDAKAKPSSSTLTGLKQVDDSTFTLLMARPNNDVPFMLATLPFCPIHATAFKDPVASDKAPLGNGPYVLSKLDAQVEAVLVRDAKYKGWVPDGGASKITFKVYKDANTAYQDVVAGNTDILRSLPPGLVAQGKNALGDKGLTAISKNTLETYITWPTYLDVKFPVNVRRAFSMIINRDAISKNLFLGSSKAARSLMPDSVAAYRADACAESCAFDPTAAKALVAKSGFTGSIPLLYGADNTTDASTALAISNEAKRIGLNVEPKPMAGTTLGDATNGYTLEGPSIALWGSSFPSASEWIASILVDANYRLKYTNAQASSEVAAAWASKDPSEANTHWQAAEDAILKDQVMQPLYFQIMYIAHNECVTPHAAGGDMQIYRTQISCKVAP